MCASTTGSHESVPLTVTVQVTVLDDVQVLLAVMAMICKLVKLIEESCSPTGVHCAHLFSLVLLLGLCPEYCNEGCLIYERSHVARILGILRLLQCMACFCCIWGYTP